MSIFHSILKKLTFQRRPKVLVCSKGLSPKEVGKYQIATNSYLEL